MKNNPLHNFTTEYFQSATPREANRPAEVSVAFRTRPACQHSRQLLSEEQTLKLIADHKSGCSEALTILLVRNIGLIGKIAHERSRKEEDLEDLMQEGRLGLMRAVEKYNPDHGTKFSTYAAIWIRSLINDYQMRTEHAVYLPRISRKFARKVSRLVAVQRATGCGVAESRRKVAEELDIQRSVIESFADLGHRAVSLTDEVGAHPEGTLTIEDRLASSDDVEGEIHSEDLQQIIGKHVGELPEKQRAVITMYFGLVGTDCLESHAEVARRLGITREYARILCKKGLAALQASLSGHGSLGFL